MRPGNLIRLKEEYAMSIDGEDREVFLVLSQNSNEEQKLYGPFYKLLNKRSTITNLPLSSIFAYEVIS